MLREDIMSLYIKEIFENAVGQSTGKQRKATVRSNLWLNLEVKFAY